MITNISTIQSTVHSTVVPLASADQIHEYLVKAYRIGNRARLRFARLLAGLANSRLFLKLGHPSIAQYAGHHFDVQRSETYELIRVAEVIDDLPECRKAFEEGSISWTTLKQVTRVASTRTEKTWLEFNEEHTFTEVRAEVQDALHKNRDVPRSDRYGLPNLTVKFTLELTLEEQARLETALEKAGAEIAPAPGEERLETKHVVLYMVERFLRTDPEGTPQGRQERNDSPYVIIYNACPECRKARLLTSDGPIEVAPESVNRLAGDAAEETIDRRNPSTLARRVKLRDGDVCQNPGCGYRGKLHAHHIKFRSHGGPTIPENEISVCRLCRIRHNRHYADFRIMPRWRSPWPRSWNGMRPRENMTRHNQSPLRKAKSRSSGW